MSITDYKDITEKQSQSNHPELLTRNCYSAIVVSTQLHVRDGSVQITLYYVSGIQRLKGIIIP